MTDEHALQVTDPLVAVAGLAREARDAYVVYERGGAWTFAAGTTAELVVTSTEITLVQGEERRSETVGQRPLDQVRRMLDALTVPWRHAYGWASFELAHLLHGTPSAAGSETLLHLMVPEREVRIDPEGRVTLWCSTERSRAELATALAGVPVGPLPIADVAVEDDADYRAAVVAAVREIRDDRLEKVILSRVVPVPVEIDLVSTYVAGRRGNTPARSFLLDLGGIRAAGFSPETVIEVSASGQVSTQPLAGTRRLVGDPEADSALRRELLTDPKEIFEHAISVRFAQEELRNLCRPDSLHVGEFLEVKERGSVQHLGSRVSGRLADGVDAWTAFGALFPAITASGVPKGPALDLIARHEAEPRGLYSGAVLAVDADGGLDAALVLRTVFHRGGRTWLRAGAGIVTMSTPERELEETTEKFRSISRFLVPAAAPTQEPGLDLSVSALRAVAAELVEEEPESIEPDGNLFELGLDSIGLMRVVSEWRRAGLQVDFAELAEHPTIDGWSKLLSGRSVGAAPGDGDTSPVGEVFPLAVLQHAYWVGRGSGQQLGGVAAHLYTEFDGTEVDPERLRDAIARLVERHEMLRVVITDNGWQRIGATSGWRGLTVHDLRDVPADEREARLAEIRDRISHQLLDIESGEVFSTALTLLPGGRTRFHLDVDMVAADAVSYRIMLADLARFYASPTLRRQPPGYGYRQYRAALPQVRRGAVERAAAWWRDRLPTLPGAPELPRASSPTDPLRVTRRAVHLSADERVALLAASRACGVTPAMALAAAFAETVGRWSAEPRFLLNVPLFDRAPIHPDVADLVGDFTSSVLLEVDLTEPATFVERARRIQARMHSDAAHADYTGVEVLRDLTRQRGGQVLAPVVFTSALNLGELFDQGVRTHFGEPVWIVSQGPQVLLDAQVTELDGGLLVNWDSRDDELAPGVVDAMFDSFAAFVRRLCADPGSWDDTVLDPLPTAQADRRALANATDGPAPGRLLHDGFFAQAGTTPGAPALLGAEPVGYGELADRALRVAAALVARGVRPGDPVGVTLPKGTEQVVAVLGVLAAGGVYVPVGVEQPVARAGRIARLAGYRVVLTDRDREQALTVAEAMAADPLPGPVPVDEEQLAYILFTSGSTGEPKGVEVPHRAAMATIADLVDRFGIGADDRTLALSALDFDLSVFDLFAPLSTGGAVVVVTDDRRDTDAWGRLVAEHDVTILNCVPALLGMLLDSGVPLGDSLRLVLLGGDWVGVVLPARLAAAVPGCRFVALGGTTETAIHSTVCEVTGPVPGDWRAVPYGTPLRNVRCRVVDPLGRDCPDWVAGELWIGGAGVARGYRGDAERTADRFVRWGGLRWYRTGDQARYRDDGTIEFLGRRDNQVKIRGLRIELGEVEAALAADPAVGAAVAVVTDGPSRALAAGVVLAVGGADAAVEGIGRRLRDVLPAHMVPGRLVALADLPLTANGKVDRRTVRSLVSAAEAPDPQVGPGPSSTLEHVVDLVWREVLGSDRLGAHQDFFAVGGDSVLATAVVARLRELLGTGSVTVRTLFAAPTVAGLAAEMLRAHEHPERLAETAEVVREIQAMDERELLAGLAELQRTEGRA